MTRTARFHWDGRAQMLTIERTLHGRPLPTVQHVGNDGLAYFDLPDAPDLEDVILHQALSAIGGLIVAAGDSQADITIEVNA